MIAGSLFLVVAVAKVDDLQDVLFCHGRLKPAGRIVAANQSGSLSDRSPLAGKAAGSPVVQDDLIQFLNPESRAKGAGPTIVQLGVAANRSRHLLILDRCSQLNIVVVVAGG